MPGFDHLATLMADQTLINLVHGSVAGVAVNWDAIGAIGEILGAIAVLVTLAYLAQQVRQNTRSMRSQSRTQILESLNSDMSRVTETDIWELGLRAATGNLEQGDEARWSYVCASWICHLEIAYFELAEESLPPAFEATLKHRLETLFHVPNFERTWQEHRGLCTEQFQSYVDKVRQEST